MYLDPKRIRLAEHFDWYEGNLTTLFQVPGTAINGIGLLGAENISTQFNYFQAVSKFMASSVETDLPATATPELEQILAKCSEHWSVANECCIVGDANNLSAVRPDYVHPVYSRYNDDIIEKILFVYPERDPDIINFSHTTFASTKAQVVEYDVDSGIAKQSIRDYSLQEVADEPKGETIDIGKVVYIRTGGPIYAIMESLVREICVRLNMLQLALNTTSLPMVQVNKEAMSDGRLANRNITLQDLKEIATGPLGITLKPPFSGETGASYIERQGRGLSESMDYVKLLIDQLSILSGTPQYIFGVDTKPKAETERILFSAQSKVNAFRRQLNEGLKQFGIDIKFSPNPFITRSERNKIFIEQLNAGIINVAETRALLGYD